MHENRRSVACHAPHSGGSHAAQDKARIPELRIERVDGEISLDGELSEPIWQKAGRIDEWFETSPGDNVSPRVESIGYLAYDDRYLYVGFDFRDPEPGRIRAPLGDRDSLTGNVDHGGILIDTRNDGRTATIFAASARGIQYDSIWDGTVATDDTAPDFYWDAAARIGSGAGPWRCAFPSRHCATPIETRRRGGSCCTGSTPASSGTRCSAPRGPGESTAGSADRIPFMA